MLDPKNEAKFMKWLADDYSSRFGYGVRNIDKCPFLTTYSVENLPKWLYSVNGNVAKSHVLDWAKELQQKGYIRFDENGYEFFFTTAGYGAVQRRWYHKLAIWLNNNPGSISAAAFLVSLGSLCVAVWALRNG